KACRRKDYLFKSLPGQTYRFKSYISKNRLAKSHAAQKLPPQMYPAAKACPPLADRRRQKHPHSNRL
ncbi:MAG: hypothetical protein K2N21_01015, partial [Rikenellaceae bacterium]|nr:hypothetical protein [Rikenellaceae bacterium]